MKKKSSKFVVKVTKTSADDGSIIGSDRYTFKTEAEAEAFESGVAVGLEGDCFTETE